MNFTDIANAIGEAAPVEPRTIPVVPGRVVDIDADILCYQCGGGDDVSVSRRILKHKVELFREASGAEKVVLHLTAGGSTKGDRALVSVTKPYQGQRKGHRPPNWQYLRDYIGEGHAGAVKLWFDREADDGMGFCSTLPNRVIVTKDKDHRMLPGLHLNWDLYEMTEVPQGCYDHTAWGKQYGLRWFWMQMLHGDSADNIPNIKRGFGEVSAHKALLATDNHIGAFDIVSQLYRIHHPDTWAARFAEQATLLWIRRGKHAELCEWLDYMPASTHPYMPEVIGAATALRQRVKTMKEEAACLSD